MTRPIPALLFGLFALAGAAAAQAPVPSTPGEVQAWAARNRVDLKGWELESTDDQSAAFYAVHAPVGPIMRLPTRIEYFAPLPMGDGQTLRSVSAIVEVDCKAERRRYVDSRLYAGNGFADFIRKDLDSAWEPFDPNNPHDDYLRRRCLGG